MSGTASRKTRKRRSGPAEPSASREVRCWMCRELVGADAAGDVCPHCLASLAPADYDAAAREATHRLSDGLKAADELEKSLAEARRRNARLGILRNLPFLPSKRRLARLAEALHSLEQALDDAGALLDEYAQARYFSSLWFKETGIVPLNCGGEDTALQEPSYDRTGRFTMNACMKNSWQRGELGEYEAFDLISEALEAGRFGYARLIPHLFVPAPASRAPGAATNTYTEVDMVLITERATFAIEVKRLHASIDVQHVDNSSGYRARTRFAGSACKPAALRAAACSVSQNEYHRYALRDFLSEFTNASAVFNVVLYVDSLDFTGPDREGARDVLIACDHRGRWYAPDIIAAHNDGKTLVRLPEDVDEAYHALKDECSDHDGSKRKLHEEELTRKARPSSSIDLSRWKCA